MIKRVYLVIIVGIIVIMFLSSSDGLAQRKKLLPDNLLSDIDKELNLAKDKLSELDPILEKKSDELLELVDKEVDKGFLALDSLNKEVEQKVDGLKKELESVLSDKNLQELANFLANLDENMIATIRQEIINQAAKRLDLTPEQLEKVAPILGVSLDKRGKLLEEFLKQGPEALEAFNLDNDKLRQDMNARLTKILTPKQMQGLEQWQTEVGGKIDKLFQEKK